MKSPMHDDDGDAVVVVESDERAQGF